ncbi:MAG: hypothetical protein J6B12_00410, partial [Clostridia bacterium]|nr:hypothetical protein [Clostridia bacterium]
PQSPDNAFSYHTAWTWLARRLNMVNPTLRDLQEAPDYEQINSEFLSFLYATCYRTVRSSIEAVDKNHMYIGSRVNGNCPYDEGYLRAAGYYLDILTINLYGGLNPSKDTLSGIYRYSGKPFIVTEFFAKGMDAIDANGYPLANSTGAGILVHAQEDRAVYYENYVLNLLETRSCVGWSWYRFRDNDQSLFRFEKDGQVYEDMRPQGMTYGKNPYPYSLADKEGNLYWLEELYSGDKTLWQNAFEKTYSGEALASNHNVNKGFYNNNFSSVVTVYTYDAGGKLQGSASYEVVHPDSATLQNGTILMSKDGTQLFTIGENGTQKTVLTVYKGRYLALTDAIKTVSDHIMGLVSYFDAN